MKKFVDRPVASFCLAFVFAAFAAGFLSVCLKLSACLSFGALFIIALAIRILIRKKDRTKTKALLSFSAVICFACAFSFAVSYLFIDSANEKYKRLCQDTSCVTASVMSVSFTSEYAGFYEIRVSEVDGERADFKALLETEGAYFAVADEFTAKVEFSPLSQYSAAFDSERYYLSKGIVLSSVMEGEPEITGKSDSPLIGLKALNSRLSGIIMSSMKRDEGGFCSALLLGNRDNLPDRAVRDFRRTGTSHLLALSGIHLSVLCAALLGFLRHITGKRVVQGAAVILFTLFYVALTGFSASVVRAGLMLIIYYIFNMQKRECDRLTALAAAVFLIIIVNPDSAVDIGLQLSFAAMLCCIAAEHYLRPTRLGRLMFGGASVFSRVCAYFLYTFVISAVVSVAIMPVYCLYFSEMSLVAPAANLLLVPLVTALLYILPVLLIVSPVPFIFYIISDAARSLCSLILSLSGAMASPRKVTVSLEYPGVLFIAALVFASVFIFVVCKKRFRKYCVLAIVFSFVLLGVHIYACDACAADRTTIVQLNSKSNDGFAAVNGTSGLLCDISDGSKSIIRDGYYALRAYRCTDVEALLLTHYHNRHINTVDWLSDVAYLRSICLPEPVSDTDKSVYSSIAAMAERKKIELVVYSRDGETELRFHDIYVKLPAYTKLSRSTHPVISLEISAFGSRLSYIGSSANESTSREFAEDIASCADVIVFGGHSPIYKSEYNYEISERLRLVIFSADSKKYAARTFYERIKDCKTVSGSSGAVLVFEKNES